MKCKNFVPKISLYIDDKLPQNEKVLFEEHLKSCKECFKEYSSLKNVRTSLMNLNKQKTGARFESIIMQKIEKKLYTPSQASTFFQTVKVSLLAAVFLFAVIAAFNFFTPSFFDKKSHDNIAALNDYVLKDTSVYDKISSGLMG
ncbi:MAG: zf-HC2 domain-containing protein [Endomicrobia bacterium]|nr:zf-HC2 domain-containing protein [Endomicrobiia bacterium]MCL2799033.1 zf-HC2 domain-containing protein [Endomicrobiia bacterium]